MINNNRYFLKQSTVQKTLIVLNYLCCHADSGCAETEKIVDCYRTSFEDPIITVKIIQALNHLTNENEIEMVSLELFRPINYLPNAMLTPSKQWALLNGLYIEDVKKDE